MQLGCFVIDEVFLKLDGVVLLPLIFPPVKSMRVCFSN